MSRHDSRGRLHRSVGALLAITGLLSISGYVLAGGAAGDDARPAGKIHPNLDARFATADGAVKAWIFFIDKGVAPEATAAALADLEAASDARTVRRRQLRRTLPGTFDVSDLPVAPAYLAAVAATGAERHVSSRWLNAISAWVTADQARAMTALPFVRSIEPVRRVRRIAPVPDARPGDGAPAASGGFYGRAEDQLAQINLISLHESGATGAGVIVGILDTGFRREHVAFNHPEHPLQVVAEYDFVDDDGDTSREDGDPSSQHNHGTLILGTLGAYAPGDLVGAAYDASFVLCKTEDVTDEYEAEEDNYVAGLEFIEMHGGDVATSSLRYIDWYTQDDMDGLTAVTTIAVNAATANGVYCCTAVGNSGHDQDPSTSSLGVPADAFQVLSCGSVNEFGEISGFSADGPTADGRVKPEVLARGESTHTVDSNDDNDYRTAGGTSLSTPLVAGAVACIAQARPAWTVDQMRQLLFETADYFVSNGTHDPQYVHGYGVIDAHAAVALDCNGNGVPDPDDIDEGTSDDVNGNGVPDECECLADVDASGAVDFDDLLAVISVWGPCEDCPEDIDGSGEVDFDDLLRVLGAWGPC